MPILGAHMSAAGGYHRAAEAAAAAKCDCFQLFLFPPRRWAVAPRQAKAKRARQQRPTAEEVARFQAAMQNGHLQHPIAHCSYLLNLATNERLLWRRSVDALVAELRCAEQLGLESVVLHPGSHMGAGEEAGIKRVCRALDEVHRQLPEVHCRCLLETTAGQGTNLGWRFEHLARMLDGVTDPDWLGVCFDTCHIFAAGYAFTSRHGYRKTMRAFDQLIGVEQIRAFHVNDSQHERGSRLDRHAHIGRGKIGTTGFQLLVRDRRFRRVPMYLETPKGKRRGTDWDQINLRTLRSLA